MTLLLSSKHIVKGEKALKTLLENLLTRGLQGVEPWTYKNNSDPIVANQSIVYFGTE